MRASMKTSCARAMAATTNARAAIPPAAYMARAGDEGEHRFANSTTDEGPPDSHAPVRANRGNRGRRGDARAARMGVDALRK